MSEPIWCDIQIKIPAGWPPGGWRDGTDEMPAHFYLGLEEGWDLHSEGEGWVIINTAGCGNYGLEDADVATFLTWCEKRRIPYWASQEAKYEFEGGSRQYRGDEGGGILDATTNNDGVPLLGEATYDAIVDGTHAWAKTVHDYFHPPTLESCDISHLPAELTEEWLEDECATG